MQIFRAIFPIAQAQNTQRSPLRLRFWTCTLKKISSKICTGTSSTEH